MWADIDDKCHLARAPGLPAGLTLLAEGNQGGERS